MMRAFCTVVELLIRIPTEPLRGGISGINKVGKTSLAEELRDVLSANFNATLVADQFKIVANRTTTERCIPILLSPLTDIRASNNADVIIYYTAVLDQHLFL